jgi:nucleoside-diphosphate-sugar epimerase
VKKLRGTFNAGYQNLSVMSIAKIVKNKILNCKILIKKSNDNRSYRLDSSKIQKTGFTYKYSIYDAIKDLIDAKKNQILKSKKNYSRVNFLLTKINKNF